MFTIYKQFCYIFTDNGTLEINKLKKKFVLTSDCNETNNFVFVNRFNALVHLPIIPFKNL